MTGKRPRLLPILALAAALAPCLAAAQPGQPLLVEFRSPAQAQGNATVAGQWALLLFRDAGPGSFALDLEAGGTVTNHTSVRWRADLPAFHPNHSPAGLPSSASPLPGAVRGRLDLVPGSWASLYVEAASLGLSALGTYAQVGDAEAGQAADAYLPKGLDAEGTYRAAGHALAGPGAWMALQGDRQPGFRFHLQAAGVRRLEWHNATLSCGAGACPGAPSREFPLASPAGSAAVDVLAYTELAVPGGTVRGDGEALVGAMGGSTLDLALAGRLRLPDASLEGACGPSACPDPDGRTFLAAGNLTLAAVAPSRPGRLQAGLAGAFGASFDESPVPAFALAAGVAAGAAAAAALPFLVRFFVALFARSKRPPALEHPKRQALYDLIRSHPGLSFREIQRRLGWPNGTLSNHMGRLLDVRLVARRPHRNTVRYFENHGRYDGSWGAVALLQDARLRDLHAWLLAHPGALQRDALRHAEADWGWRRSTTQDRLRALCDGRLAERSALGRSAAYRARPAPSASFAGRYAGLAGVAASADEGS